MRTENFQHKDKSDEQIYNEIKELYESGTQRHKIARKMGISLESVDRCCSMLKVQKRFMEQAKEKEKKEKSVSIIVESQNEHDAIISRINYHVNNLRIEEEKKKKEKEVIERKEETKEPKKERYLVEVKGGRAEKWSGYSDDSGVRK